MFQHQIVHFPRCKPFEGGTETRHLTPFQSDGTFLIVGFEVIASLRKLKCQSE
jgi:hypothetical protein